MYVMFFSSSSFISPFKLLDSSTHQSHYSHSEQFNVRHVSFRRTANTTQHNWSLEGLSLSACSSVYSYCALGWDSNLLHHSLCGSNNLLHKRWALSMTEGKFWHPTTPTYIDRSSWNSNLRNTSGRPPHRPNLVKSRITGWADSYCRKYRCFFSETQYTS